MRLALLSMSLLFLCGCGSASVGPPPDPDALPTANAGSPSAPPPPGAPPGPLSQNFIQPHEKLHAQVIKQLVAAYAEGAKGLRGNTPLAERVKVSKKIIPVLDASMGELEQIEKNLRNVPPQPYTVATFNLTHAWGVEAAVYKNFALAVQKQNPGADPKFMGWVRGMETTALQRVKLTKEAQDAYDKLPSKTGLTRPQTINPFN